MEKDWHKYFTGHPRNLDYKWREWQNGKAIYCLCIDCCAIGKFWFSSVELIFV